MFWPDPTHQPTHPPTQPSNYTPTHGWRILHRFQIFKQNWNISISLSAIEFWLIPGVPPFGGWGWVHGDGTLSGCLGGAPYMCTHTHMHARMSDDVIKGFPRISLWEQPFAWNYHVYTCMHVCAHACVCAHAWGTPQTPWQSPTPIQPPPPPQRGGPPESVKIQ